jgi:hypothetical protein
MESQLSFFLAYVVFTQILSKIMHVCIIHIYIYIYIYIYMCVWK